MRGLRLGAALGVAGLTPRIAAVLAGGWLALAAALGLAAATGRTSGFAVGAFVSAAAAWLVLVLFVLALEELWETLSGRPDAELVSRLARGWVRPIGPVLAIVAGLLVGLLWR